MDDHQAAGGLRRGFELRRRPEFLKFTYLLPPDRNEHAIDVRDVATAFANAVEADCVGRTFDIAGGEGWYGMASELQAMMMEAKGVAPPPAEAYRMADPEVDASWYFEDHVDTTESQRVLQYQNHTFEEYADEIRVRGFKRLMMKADRTDDQEEDARALAVLRQAADTGRDADEAGHRGGVRTRSRARGVSRSHRVRGHDPPSIERFRGAR